MFSWGRDHLIKHMFRERSQPLQTLPNRFHGATSGQRFAAHAQDGLQLASRFGG